MSRVYPLIKTCLTNWSQECYKYYDYTNKNICDTPVNMFTTFTRGGYIYLTNKNVFESLQKIMDLITTFSLSLLNSNLKNNTNLYELNNIKINLVNCSVYAYNAEYYPVQTNDAFNNEIDTFDYLLYYLIIFCIIVLLF